MIDPAHRSAGETLRECHDCGLIQTMPASAPGAEISCVRCGNTLRRCRAHTSVVALAFALTSMALFWIAVCSPFLAVDIVSQQRETTMISLPLAFAGDGMWELGLLVLLTSIVMPFCKIAVVLLTLLGLRTTNPPGWLPGLFRIYQKVGTWAMVEVFLLGVFVAFTRLGAIATVQVGIALYALGALMLTMVLTDYLIDYEAVWTEMAARGLVSNTGVTRSARDPVGCGDCGLLNDAAFASRCTRCGGRLHRRRPDSVNRTWALLAAATLLYIPANLYPILTLQQLGSGSPSTILGGAAELLDAGMWPLALLVLVASVLVPAFKLLGLVFMLIETRRHSGWRLRDRTRLYRMIAFIGRWSMLDIFMLSTLVGLVRAGKIALITPGFGAVCFASVVIITMIAAECFDPRLMWDAAAAPAPAPARPAPAQTRIA